MKKILLFSLICFSLSTYAQVLNGGFESWTSGALNNWETSNVSTFFINCTQSSTAHSGSSSLKGVVGSFSSMIFPPFVQAGVSGGGFSVSQRYATISGYYQFAPLQGDKFTVYAILYKGTSAIAEAGSIITDAASTWTQFSIDFLYYTNDVPDNCKIQIDIAPPTTSSQMTVGSSYLLDDVALTGTATGINDHNINSRAFSLEQNYPNPFNPSTTISYTLPERLNASLTIYNQLGQKVDELFNDVKEAGSYSINWNASKLSSGTYFYELKTDKFREIKKLLLMK